RHPLLLRLLPRHHAGSRPGRDAAPHSELDHGSGPGKEERQVCRAGSGISGRRGIRTMKKLVATLLSLAVAGGLATAVFAEEAKPAAEAAEQPFPIKEPREQHWSFSGPFGTYDKQQLQRGLKVYTEVCSACHSMNLVAFRTLEDLGYTPAQIKV